MRPVLIVHGGAGPRRSHADPRDEDAMREQLAAAVAAGLARLADGGGAADACADAVAVLEDCEAFNAGTGSALADDGGVWCDAAIARGDGPAGAVAAVRGIANPVRAAEALMRAGGPLLWAGHTEELAARYGLALVDPATMVTERQRRRLARHRERGGEPARGTVGAVCLDPVGGLAAATSTGGYVGKPPARVGDSPLLGAGTWASPDCAISATGDGEAFMRTGFAYVVQAGITAGRPLHESATAALAVVRSAGGLGGAVCVGRDGAVAMPITAEVMYRAWHGPDGVTRTAVRAAEQR
jgi:beta-aspartyl-peptidase (threonine type)